MVPKMIGFKRKFPRLLSFSKYQFCVFCNRSAKSKLHEVLIITPQKIIFYLKY